MNAFELLPEFLQKALKCLDITEPTPVQEGAIAPALRGQDVLATAQTGTGKTFAFLLPLAARITRRKMRLFCRLRGNWPSKPMRNLTN